MGFLVRRLAKMDVSPYRWGAERRFKGRVSGGCVGSRGTVPSPLPRPPNPAANAKAKRSTTKPRCHPRAPSCHRPQPSRRLRTTPASCPQTLAPTTFHHISETHMRCDTTHCESRGRRLRYAASRLPATAVGATGSINEAAEWCASEAERGGRGPWPVAVSQI